MEAIDRLSFHIGTALLSYAALCTLLVIYFCLTSGNRKRSRQNMEPAFILASLAVMVFAWLPLIFYNRPLNPDEAQMIANAQKFSTDLMTWRSVDSTTAGPLNSMALMWPLAFGADVSIPVARLMTVILAAGTWLCTYFSLSGTQPAVRVGITSTLLIFLAGAQFFDFTHYSSERLPMFLLSVATLITVILANGYRGSHLGLLLVLAGVALGSVPFAKLQAGPIAVVLGLALACLIAFAEGPWRRKLASLSALALGTVVAPAAILLPLVLAGSFTDFWTSYIGFALDYVTITMTSLRQFTLMIRADQLLIWFMLSTAALSVAGGAFWVLGFIQPTRSQRILAGILLCVVATTIYVILRPGRGFSHYLLLLPATFAVLAGILWPNPARSSTPTFPRWHVWVGAVIPAAFLLLQGAHAVSTKYDRELEVTGAEEFFRSGNFLDWLPARPPRMLVWGWMSEWYVYSGLRPATRDIHTQNQLLSYARSYYRQRLVRDFDPSRTSVVVDACAPGSFFCNDSSWGLGSFPELDRLVVENFTALPSHSGVDTPTTYLRNDLVPELQKSLIPMAKITASSQLERDGESFSPDRVDDFSVYDTGRDYWLLPDGKSGWLDVGLKGLQPVSEIWLLNTRDDYRGDRATRYVRIDVSLRGKLLYRTKLKLERFPYWTKLKVSKDGMAADGLRITILKFAGKGGGLNEIKLLTPYGAMQQAAIDRAIRSD